MGFFSDTTNDEQYTEKLATSDRPGNPFFTVIDPVKVDDFTEKASRSLGTIFNRDVVKDTLDQIRSFEGWSNGFGSTPGLKAYPVPTIEKYNTCAENNGVSAWDENGWWRCLFPNSVARKGETSIEDVNNDYEHKQGIFFKDYNNYLSWKSQLSKLIKEQKLQKQRENIQNIYDDYEKDNNLDLTSDSSVVSTSKSVYFRTLENGDGEEITKIKNVFKDGKRQNESIKKIFPKDGGEPIITTLDDNKSKGWIWNSDK